MGGPGAGGYAGGLARRSRSPVPHIAEIVAFIRIAEGALSPERLAPAIRRRWPQATPDEVREAVARAATFTPNDAAERAAMDAAAAVILGRPMAVSPAPRGAVRVRGPFRSRGPD